MNIFTFSLLVILVSIPTLHGSQRESSCSSTSSGTITSSSKQKAWQQRLQKIHSNIMTFTLNDLAHSHEEKKDEKQTNFKIGDLVAQLPCGDRFCHADLERSMEGRAEGVLPKCPKCNHTFEMDQVVWQRITEEKNV